MREKKEFNAIENKNYFHNNNIQKNKIVVGVTKEPMFEYINHLKRTDIISPSKIPHAIIDKKGNVTQLVPYKDTTEIFDDKKLNTTSIYILLENLGYIEKIGSRFFDYRYRGVNGDNVRQKSLFGKKYWDSYTVEQENALVNLCYDITEEFPLIKKEFIGFYNKNNTILNFNGIIFMSNISLLETVSPLFNIDLFNILLNEKENYNINIEGIKNEFV